MVLYGRLKAVEGGKMLFEANLKVNLDEADRVYNGINALIDRHIGEKGVNAPEGRPYMPVWEPTQEPAEFDLKAAGVGAVVWATGFALDWSYARLPIFDGTGYPVHRHGVTGVPGAYVLGLPWLWTWGSGRFLSVGRDAGHIVRHEIERTAAVIAVC
jgi:putative flavoprotein involved in K+ transport